ncbi:MAG TPA: DUF3168 domain-containing protein [Terracidiphilus sp.]|nr:DUF3168 domain-containing protein [Terracidiphilus sp.]
MLLQEGLAALLAADASILGLVGSRIYGVLAPDDAAQYPCCSYSLIGGTAETTLDGVVVREARLELNGFSLNSYREANTIREALIAAVDGWTATLGAGLQIGAPTTQILEVTLLNPGTDFCSVQRVFRCLCEFRVLYTVQLGPAAVLVVSD